MKPVRIEPKDVYITFEISSSQLESLIDFLENSFPVFKGKLNVSPEYIEHINDIVVVGNELLKHPLVERELKHGS